MKKTIILGATALFLTFGMASCDNGNADLIEGGKINVCKLKHAKEDLEAHPDNAMFKADVEELEMLVKTGRSMVTDVAEFDDAMEEHLKTCE